MIDPKKIEQIARQVHESMPKGLRDLGEDVEKKIRQALQSQLTRLADFQSRHATERPAALHRLQETALAGDNLAGAPGSERHVPVTRHWHDVATGVSERFDAIVCNPPFHALGRGDRPDIGRAFIAAAADALKPGGRLWLVANRHLPYEQALGEGFAQVATLAQNGGFKIVEAIKTAR